MLPPELLVACVILVPFLVFTNTATLALLFREKQSHAFTKETMGMIDSALSGRSGLQEVNR